jgi:hypothetical protein
VEKIYNNISEGLGDKELTPERCESIISALFGLGLNRNRKGIDIPFLVEIRFKSKIKHFMPGLKYVQKTKSYFHL